MISELMAANSSTLADEDGDEEDWIEIHNRSSGLVDLAGWHLTDTVANRMKWRFPSTNLHAGGYLVVFASNKDRHTPGRPLHTNFRLSNSGEYLALVEPDGQTLATEFAPMFPPQVTDASHGYGVEQSSRTLVSTSALARVRVPVDGALGLTWTRPDFDDSAWPAGTNGLGFETVMSDPAEDSYAALVLASAPLGWWRFSEASGTSAMNLGLLGAAANALYVGGVGLGQSGPRPAFFGGFEADNTGAQFNGSSTRVQVPDHAAFDFGTGPYSLVLWFNPANAAVRGDLFTYKGSGNDFGIHMASSAANTVSLYHNAFIGTGGSVVNNQWHYLVVTREASGRCTGWLNGAVIFTGTDTASMNIAMDLLIGCNHTGTPSTPGIVFNGWIDEAALYDRALTGEEVLQHYQAATSGGGSYASLIATDLGAPMAGESASAYIRFPFVLTNVASVGRLVLKMNYDDGFVAYINGVEATAANAPDLTVWNSAATARHADSAGRQFEDFNLSDARQALVDGTNVLAIQGLNVSATNSDFLILAELVATSVGRYGDTPRYFMVPTPGDVNGAGAADLGPILTHVGFTPAPPLRPLDGDDLTVTARVAAAFSPVSTVALRYRVMFGPTNEVIMADDGAHGDGRAGDGIFGGIIPAAASTAGQMVRFCVMAEDALGRASRWPLFEDPMNSPESMGTVIAHPAVTSGLPIWEWFTENVTNARNRTGTRGALWYDGEFYDNIFIRQRGGYTATGSQKFDFNTGRHCRINDELGRVEEANLNNNGSDASYIRQPMAFEAFRVGGHPASVSFHVLMRVNSGADRIGIFVEQVDERFLDRNGLDREGAMYKFIQRGAGTPVFSDASDGVEKKTRLHENNSDLQAFIDGLSQTNAADRRAWFFDNINVPNFLNYAALRSVTRDADDVRKNFYWYRDTLGTREWSVFPWDKDWTFGIDGDSMPGLTHPFFGDYAHRKVGTDQWNRFYEFVFNDPVTRPLVLRRLRTVMDQMLQPPGTTNGWFEERAIAWMRMIARDAGAGVSNQIAGVLSSLPARRTDLYVTYAATNTAAGANALVPLPPLPNALPRISAIEFSPASGNQAEEYIEFTNASPAALDLSGWRLEGAVQFTFRPGTVIGAHDMLYVTPDVHAFRARAAGPRGGRGLFVQGNYQGWLSARGETLRLLDPLGRLVQTAAYPGDVSRAQQWLRITELMYHPAALPGDAFAAEEYEFIELRNLSTNATLDLTGVCLSSGVQFNFSTGAVTALGPGEAVLVVKNPAAYAARYGIGFNIAGAYAGSLDNAGERLQLLDGRGEEILDFSYNNAWYALTDGLGFSLVTVDAQAEPDAWGRPAHWRASGQIQGTPAAGEPDQPLLPPVQISEALTRSETPPPLDSVELFNPTTHEVAVGGWFLTDDRFAPGKFRIPDGTVIPAGGWVVFDESQFNPGGVGFALSADGDEVWLYSADAEGNLTGYACGFDFGPADEGVSFGRHVTSDGRELFVAESALTLGTNNAGPRIGPVVINELMVHPPDFAGGGDNADDEFIELLNFSSEPVALFDPNAPARTWEIHGGVDYAFPTNVILAPGELVLLVNFNPTNLGTLNAFRARYGVGPSMQIFGPYGGKLDNDTHDVELKRPALLHGTNLAHVLVDKVDYREAEPWPRAADGYGFSLQRTTPTAFGNDPANWRAARPTPAAPTVASGAPPQITTPPLSQWVVAYQGVWFSVSATGTAPLQYQWRLNGLNLPDATNGMLALNAAQPEQGGDYEVVVFNAAGAVVSPKATLQVRPPASILQQPQSVSVRIRPDALALPATNATFSVQAWSPSALSYHWRCNARDIPDATSATLTLTNVQAADWGEYTVAITDDAGTVVSAPAWLYPLVKPGFAASPISQSVPVGSAVSLSGMATGWPPPFTFEWRRVSPGAILATNVHVHPEEFHTLTATNVPASVAYRLVLKNAAFPNGVATNFTITTLPDSDGDGLPNAWETTYGLSATDGADGLLDADDDGMLNRQEYVAGTDPTNALSCLRLGSSVLEDPIELSFEAISNRTYTIEYTGALDSTSWSKLADVLAAGTNRSVIVTDPKVPTPRFYRLLTPRRP